MCEIWNPKCWEFFLSICSLWLYPSDWGNKLDVCWCNLFFCRSENDPTRYRDGYSKLRSWAYNSLDLYKVSIFLYPFLVSFCFEPLRKLMSCFWICSMSCSEWCIQCLFIVTWILLVKDTLKKVLLKVTTISHFEFFSETVLILLVFQREPSLTASGKIMKWYIYGIFRSLKAFLFLLI